MPPAVRLGSLQVSASTPPVFLPDIDLYFHGDVALALELLERLEAAGAQVVKGALIHDLETCFDGPVEAAYYRPGRGVVKERYRDVMKRHLLPLEDARVIYRRARDLGLEVVLTVYDVEGADFALAAGAAGLKVASSNITHAPLIRHLARQPLPLIIDTGRSTLDEIDRAVAWAREAGAKELIVQHSPAAPPASLAEHHLRMMAALGERFDCPYGLSDHHAGNEMMPAAVALGASVIEKGICADGSADDIDLAHAARIGDVPAILAQISNVWQALGSTKRELPADRPRPADRMGLVAARALRPGDTISAETVRFAFAVPQETVLVESWDSIEGARVANEIPAKSPVRWRDVVPKG
jgi:sialic acid synthase SpsE